METTTLLILGASGDLTSRLLLPALGQLLRREPDRNIRLLGSSTRELSTDEWRGIVKSAVGDADDGIADELTSEGGYRAADATDPDSLARLLEGVAGRLIIYFALPPAVTRMSCEALTRVPLPPHTVLALEKPFGTDLRSARELNEVLQTLVPEEQVFRVDHFLGRSTLLNLLSVRFANRVFGPVWNADSIHSVDIVFDETLALEGRAGYYDRAGAMVDMIQSHLLQVLGLVALEAPGALDAEQLRSAKVEALRATRVWAGDPVASSRRARYTAGRIGTRDVVSYVDEPGVDGTRLTETFAEVSFEVRTPRWEGVPFRLRSGKALGADRSEVSLRFRGVEPRVRGFTGSAADGGRLTFTLGPDELQLELNVTGGDDPFELRRETLTAGLGEGQLLAYSEVLSEILDGDVTLSVRADGAEECWRIIEPVREAWARGDVPLEEYAAGTRGPA